LDSRNYLKISPSISYSTVNSTNHSNDTIKNRNIISERVYQASDEVSTPNFDMDILYSRAFDKPGRKFLLNMQGKYSKRDKLEDINDYFESINAYSGQPVQEDAYMLSQQINSQNQNRVGRLKASFVEPIDKSSILEI